MNRGDAYDVIIDPENASRTASLRRNMALRLSAQAAFDSWYSVWDPSELAEKMRNPKPTEDPSRVLMTNLLELSGSVDAKMLDVLRDVGVGAQPIGILGTGISPPTSAQSGEVTEPKRKRGLFG